MMMKKLGTCHPYCLQTIIKKFFINFLCKIEGKFENYRFISNKLKLSQTLYKLKESGCKAIVLFCHVLVLTENSQSLTRGWKYAVRYLKIKEMEMT